MKKLSPFKDALSHSISERDEVKQQTQDFAKRLLAVNQEALNQFIRWFDR